MTGRSAAPHSRLIVLRGGSRVNVCAEAGVTYRTDQISKKLILQLGFSHRQIFF